LRPRADNRDIAYKVDPSGSDPWPILGTLLLVVFLLAFALIIWQGRQISHPTSHKVPTDHIVLVASPQPTNVGTPSPEPTPASAPLAQAQLPDTGPGQSNAQAAAPTRPTSAPTVKPTAAPKPTATHQHPTVIVNVTPKAGAHPLHVTADCNSCWDATGIVSYQFNWGDGLIDPPQSSPVATHDYLQPGSWWITITAVNSVGLASSSSASVTAY
jgi:hypothetical protein